MAIENNRWTASVGITSMELMDLPRMPLKTAAAVTLFYALGYPIGTLAVAGMTPMAALVLRFSLAGNVRPSPAGALIERIKPRRLPGLLPLLRRSF